MVPLVLEMAEYMAEESQHSLWSFVDSISELSPALSELGMAISVHINVVSMWYQWYHHQPNSIGCNHSLFITLLKNFCTFIVSYTINI